MAKLSISMSHDEPALDHNRRAYTPTNVYEELIRDDVFIDTCPDLEKAFNKIFDEAREEYNSKQKREDRKIGNYYKKVEERKDDKAPKPVYEYVLQFGDMYTNNVHDPNAEELVEDCKQMLLETVEAIKEKFPNFVIVSAIIHMDEQTPHAHIDFVPVGEGYKNGMSKQCSLTKALAQMGYKNTTENDPETGNPIRRLAITHWQDDVKNIIMTNILKAHGHERDFKGNTDKHASIDRAKQILDNKRLVEKGERLNAEVETLEFQKQMRIVDIENIPPRPADISKPEKPEKPVRYIGEPAKDFHERNKEYKIKLKEYENYPKAKAKRDKEQANWDDKFLTAENLRAVAIKNENDRQRNNARKKELDEREKQIEEETSQRVETELSRSERLANCMKVSEEWEERYSEIFERTVPQAAEMTRTAYHEQEKRKLQTEFQKAERNVKTHEHNVFEEKQNIDCCTTSGKKTWEH